MRMAAGLVVVMLLGAACEKAGDLGKGKDDDKDRGDETTDTGTATADGPNPLDPNGGFCETAVAESDPPSITMVCQLTEGTTLTEFKLDPPADPETIRVSLDGTALESDRFSYDAATSLLTILDAFTESTITISYSEPQSDTVAGPLAVKAKVVDASELDGCKFLLELENGKRLVPLNLSKAMQVAGLVLKVSYVAEQESSSSCMAGTIVNVVSADFDDTDCTTQRQVGNAILDEIDAESKACGKDDDCVLAAFNPYGAECAIRRVGTTKAALNAERAARLLKAQKNAFDHCPKAPAQTQAACPGTPVARCVTSQCKETNG